VKVFNEDFPVLEAQQRNLELKPDAPKVDIKVDAAPLAARRMLEALLARER
jgi:vanillate O-demethylase oxygenase-like protein